MALEDTSEYRRRDASKELPENEEEILIETTGYYPRRFVAIYSSEIHSFIVHGQWYRENVKWWAKIYIPPEK